MKKILKISASFGIVLATIVAAVFEIRHMVADGTRFTDANPIYLITLIIFGGCLAIAVGSRKENKIWWAMAYCGLCIFISTVYYGVMCATHHVGIEFVISYPIVGVVVGGLLIKFGLEEVHLEPVKPKEEKWVHFYNVWDMEDDQWRGMKHYN